MEVSIGKPLHIREDRHHRIVKIAYKTGGSVFNKKIWLKYRSDFERLYKIQVALYDKLEEGQKIIPKPFFFCDWNGSTSSVIAMEYVEGVSLRRKVLQGTGTKHLWLFR